MSKAKGTLNLMTKLRRSEPAKPRSHQQEVRAQLRRAQSNLGTAIAVIKDALKGEEITSYKIRQYCDEAVLAIEAIESLRSNDQALQQKGNDGK